MRWTKIDFDVLSASLRPTGDAAIRDFVEKHGIARKRFKIETKVFNDMPFQPSAHAVKTNSSILCVEVSERPYHKGLDRFMNFCLSNSKPVQVYVAMPRPEKQPKNYKELLDQAREVKAGVLEVSGKTVTIIQEAVTLSLATARHINTLKFPAALRADLMTTERTFFYTDSASGCLGLYKEIEDLNRRVLDKLVTDHAFPKPPFDIGKESWSNIIGLMKGKIAVISPICPQLTRQVFARLDAVTDYRNSCGHKPKSIEARIILDNSLRSMFDTGQDLLLEFINSTKPLKLF